MRVIRPQGSDYRIGNTFDVREHIAVPETQHAPTILFEPNSPLRIRPRASMLAAVQFDNQPMLDTSEIGDEATYRTLTPEFAAR